MRVGLGALGFVLGLACADRSIEEIDPDEECRDYCTVGDQCDAALPDESECLAACRTDLYWEECGPENAALIGCLDGLSCTVLEKLYDPSCFIAKHPCDHELRAQAECWTAAAGDED